MFNINTTGSTINPYGDEIINNASFTTTSNSGTESPKYCYTEDKSIEKGEKEYRKYLLFLDKLTLRYSRTIPINFKELNSSNNEFRFALKQDNSNPNYGNCYEIYYRTTVFGKIYTNPKNISIEHNSVAITISNQYLYNQWTTVLKELQLILGLDFLRISYLDLALDSPLIARVIKLCREYLQNQVIIINNDKILIDPKAFKKSNRSWGGYSIGSRKSNKWFTCYNKTKEISQRSDKKYILKSWEEHDLELGDDIFRLELHLKGKNLAKYNLSLEDLTDSNKLISLFKFEWDDYIIFYQAKLSDIKTGFRKGRLIAKSKRKKPINWEQIEFEYEPLLSLSISNSGLSEAKRNITYQIRSILQISKAEATEALVSSFQYSEWDSTLVKHLERKSEVILGNKIREPEFLILGSFIVTMKRHHDLL